MVASSDCLQRHPPPRKSHHRQRQIPKVHQPQPDRNRAVPRMIPHIPPPEVQRETFRPRPQPHIRNPPQRQNHVVIPRTLPDALRRQHLELCIQFRRHYCCSLCSSISVSVSRHCAAVEHARAGTSSGSISPFRFQKTVPASTKFTDHVRIQRKNPAGTNSPGLFTYRGASG